jgi:hypothetical protein
MLARLVGLLPADPMIPIDTSTNCIWVPDALGPDDGNVDLGGR